MHDDQHGTAIVVLAAMLGATSVVGDDLAPHRIVPSPLDPRVRPAVAAAVADTSGG